MRTLLWFLAGTAFAAGCGDPALKAAGEECFATSECDVGLTCDFGQDPPVCSDMQTPQPDAAPMIDADPNAPDADPSAPDAAPVIDAPPGTPDAAPMIDAAPDAAPMIDAAPDAGGT